MRNLGRILKVENLITKLEGFEEWEFNHELGSFFKDRKFDSQSLECGICA